MSIDWKHLATTPGYRSLKAAYCKDLAQKSSLRSKKELYKHFQWVINRAKHTAYATDTPIEEVLNAWEEKRTYGWLNYYQDCNQRKKHSASLLPVGSNGLRKYYKKQQWSGSSYLPKHKVNSTIKKEQQANSKKTKPRWTTEKKKLHQRLKNL